MAGLLWSRGNYLIVQQCWQTCMLLIGVMQTIFRDRFPVFSDPYRDQSKPMSGALKKSARFVRDFFHTYGMTDTLRYRNPKSIQYSFFSSVQQSYSRIVLIFMDKRMFTVLKSGEYTGIIISDHSPISMRLCFPNNRYSKCMWRLNPRQLAGEEFVTFVSSQIDFLQTNQTPDLCVQTIWKAMQAYFYDQIVAYNANRNKVRTEKVNLLISEIYAIDQEHSLNPSIDLYMKCVALQTL